MSTAVALVLAAFAIVAFECSPASAESAPKLSKAMKAELAAIDASVMNQIGKCWNPPPVQSLAVQRMVVVFDLARSGALLSQPKIMEARSEGLTPAQVAAALSAVQTCAPYALPAHAYDYWRHVQVNFVLKPRPPASSSPQ